MRDHLDLAGENRIVLSYDAVADLAESERLSSSDLVRKATAKSLGLVKIGDFIVHNDDAVLAGKVKVISHLVKIENA